MFLRAAREANRQDRYGKGDWKENEYVIQKIQCTGKESNLFDCPHYSTTSCSGKSAGVSCIFNKGTNIIYIYFVIIMVKL